MALERARSELLSPRLAQCGLITFHNFGNCVDSSKFTARTMSAIAETAVDDGEYDAALDIMDDPRFSNAECMYCT